MAILFIAISNIGSLRRILRHPQTSDSPRVSVLVPARNEEANIGSCVRSILEQEYPNFELIVIDDDSSDRTLKLLEELRTEDQRMRVMKSQPLPQEWVGKNWACHQLAQAADGELLLFTDADTRHHPEALGDAVATLLADELDVVTALPKQEIVSLGEMLVIPFMSWSIISFLPLRLAYKSRPAALSATIGQYMLFRRQAYEDIGGHESVRQHALDDLMLGRRIKAHRLRWRLLDGSGRINCRMYQNFHQIWEGVSKNLFAVFEYNVAVFLFIWIWLSIVFFEPIVVLILGLAIFSVSTLSIILAAIAVAISLISWGITHFRFGFPLYLMFLYPITMLLALAIATRSILISFAGRATWKERTLNKPAIRWW